MPCFVGNRLVGYDNDSEYQLIEDMIENGTLIPDLKSCGYILADEKEKHNEYQVRYLGHWGNYTMDIGSKNSYPSSALSNFAPHPFTYDGVGCASMEGFLQSLKFKDANIQAEICKLVGIKAKNKGRKKNWYATQTLWWKGNPIPRDSQEYQDLLTGAYDALFENSGFRDALKAAGDCTFTHSIGKRNMHDTVLTVREFCSQLNRLRKKL